LKNWFAEWFDSDHYHLLYQHRDEDEAGLFINNLFGFLSPSPTAKVLDLACGKGRHAIQVNQLGYEVTGVDLSRESIAHAKKFSNPTLHFEVADMRYLPYSRQFDLSLNLFTSFGYFLQEGDNRKVIHSLSQALKSGGLLVLDYLNINKACRKLPQAEDIERGSLKFHIEKFIEGNFIVKDIRFRDKEKDHHYREYVKLINLPTFEDYFQTHGLKLKHTFGNYQLQPFDEKTSDRLILIAEKLD
jgi:SAM-dependent methyltransferase